MKVYHGSYTEIDKIDLSKGELARDFGLGFYVTNLYRQAEYWATRKGKQRKTQGVVNEYVFYESAFVGNYFKTLRFADYSEEWLDFVVMNRQNDTTQNLHDYDIVEGPVADDDIATRIEVYVALSNTKESNNMEDKILNKIPDIQKLYTFIDFLAGIETDCIKKVPLVNELLDLDKQRNQLNPNEKFTDKQKYDEIQFEIEVKFDEIDQIYSAISNKLIELDLLEKEDKLKNIRVNRDVILEFKKAATEEQAKLMRTYIKKYTNFRQNTNIDVFCGFIFRNLDEILKDLYKYFNDSEENDFISFEQQIVKCNNIEEMAEKISEDFKNGKKNVKYTIPTPSLQKNQKTTHPQIILNNNIQTIDNSQNISVSDNAKVETIIGGQNNSLKNNGIEDKESTRINKKVLCWTIIGVIVAILGIVIANLIK